MADTPWGSGSVSWAERIERAYREILRRVKLEAKNDPNFVPTPGDAVNTLAARRFVLPVAIPERSSSDANDVMAGRVFARLAFTGIGTPLNMPWTLVQRGGNGEFAAGTIICNIILEGGIPVDGAIFADATDGTVIRVMPGATYDLVMANAGGAIVAVPTGTKDVELGGSLKVLTGFGCNGQTPQTAYAVSGAVSGVGGSANDPYDTATQTLINDLAGAVNAHTTLINDLRAALIANGIAA